MRCSKWFVLALALLLSAPSWAESYSGGSGTVDDPYLITDVNDLVTLSQQMSDWSGHFQLINDLDLSQASDPMQPIGNEFHPFIGLFDGQGHVICHLQMNGESYLGLFGACGSKAIILNLGLDVVDINGTGQSMGGLVGWNDKGATIISCYSTGSIGGTCYVGGLVGLNDGSITSCFCTGSVSGGDYYVGGLVGENDGSITSSYSTSSVYGQDGIGGLVGYNDGSVTSSFWDIETSGLINSDSSMGLTTAQMQDVVPFLDAGWDFVGQTAHGTCNYWLEQEGDYPRLAVFVGVFPHELLGSGTIDDPYLITNIDDLGIVWSRPDASYRLESDIDLTGTTWNSSVVPGFTGNFDGNGYLIRNLHIEGGGYLGLFGTCTSEASISNLGLEQVDVNGLGYFVGGLVGLNDEGDINSSTSAGSVCGDGCVGGLVGLNDHGSLNASSSTGSVCGDRCVGGLVGMNDNGAIHSSYSTGSVSGDDDIGGLVGYHYFGTITSSYSAGSVSGDNDIGGLVGYSYFGIITSSFWDIVNSGQTESDGGIGLSTIPMQDIDTFLDAGWDFVDETANGTQDIWWMPVSDYPRLR